MARSRQDADNRPGNSVPCSVYVCIRVSVTMSVYNIYIHTHIRMYVGVRVRVNPAACESRYIVPLIITPVCRSLTHARVNLRREKKFR